MSGENYVQQNLHVVFEENNHGCTTFANLTDRTMINMKWCICLALTTTKQKINGEQKQYGRSNGLPYTGNVSSHMRSAKTTHTA